MAFELARHPGEIASIFGTGSCQATLIHAQVDGLLLDGLAFIPSYTAFLALGALALRRRARVACQLAIAMALVAGLLDEIEGGLLYTLLRTLPGSQWVIDLLYWEVRAKFALLALAGILIAWGFVSARRLGLLAAVPMIGGGLWSVVLILSNMHSPVLMQGFTWSWIALLLAAAVGSFWPRAFSAAPGAPRRARASPSA
jgi:hypothetical protein